MCVYGFIGGECMYQARSVVKQWGGVLSLSSGPIHVHSTLWSERTIKLDAVTEPCMFF